MEQRVGHELRAEEGREHDPEARPAKSEEVVEVHDRQAIECHREAQRPEPRLGVRVLRAERDVDERPGEDPEQEHRKRGDGADPG